MVDPVSQGSWSANYVFLVFPSCFKRPKYTKSIVRMHSSLKRDKESINAFPFVEVLNALVAIATIN